MKISLLVLVPIYNTTQSFHTELQYNIKFFSIQEYVRLKNTERTNNNNNDFNFKHYKYKIKANNLSQYCLILSLIALELIHDLILLIF